jgi:glycosyltransferase involved in cell wall biosynthesis
MTEPAGLRILLLVPEYPPDAIGGGSVVFEALRREYSARHQVKVLSGSTGASTDSSMDFADDVIRVPEIPLPKTLRYLATTMPPTPAGAVRIFRTIQDVDVVHAHGFGFFTVDIGIRLAARRGIPVLHTFHGFPVSQTKRGVVIRAAFRAYDRFSGIPALRCVQAFTAVSAPVTDLYQRRYRLNVTTVPNGVDLPDEIGWREFDSLRSGGRPLVVSVGRLEWIKGMDTVIRSLPLIREALRPNVAFIGPDHGGGDSLRELAHRSGVGHLCHFLGAQSRGRVVHAYRSAEVCVVASHTEAFPAVPLEAMLAGTALVTSRLPGIRTYAVEGVNCEMFTAGDENELAVTLSRLLADADLRTTLATAGAAVARRFSWPSVAREYERLLVGLNQANESS